MIIKPYKPEIEDPRTIGLRRADWLMQRRIREVVEKHDFNLRKRYYKRLSSENP